MPIIILGKIEKKNIIDATQEQEIDTKNMHNKIQLILEILKLIQRTCITRFN